MEKSADITIVLDRSGSMKSIKEKTIEGFNGFISSQLKMKVNARMTLVQFDHEYQLLYEAVKLKHVNELNDYTYIPRGMTALLDAIGKTIKLTSTRYNNISEEKRPDKMIFVIITDGHENASTSFSREKIFKMIKKMENKRNWEFIYLGANQDAIAEACKYGIMEKRAMTFAADSDGASHLFKSLSDNVSRCIKNDTEFEFTVDQRDKQKR